MGEDYRRSGSVPIRIVGQIASSAVVRHEIVGVIGMCACTVLKIGAVNLSRAAQRPRAELRKDSIIEIKDVFQRIEVFNLGDPAIEAGVEYELVLPRAADQRIASSLAVEEV